MWFRPLKVTWQWKRKSGWSWIRVRNSWETQQQLRSGIELKCKWEISFKCSAIHIVILGSEQPGGGGQDRRSKGGGVFETQIIAKVIAPKKFRKKQKTKKHPKTQENPPKPKKPPPKSKKKSKDPKIGEKFAFPPSAAKISGGGVPVWSTGGGVSYSKL